MSAIDNVLVPAAAGSIASGGQERSAQLEHRVVPWLDPRAAALHVGSTAEQLDRGGKDQRCEVDTTSPSTSSGPGRAQQSHPALQREADGSGGCIDGVRNRRIAQCC